MGNKRIDLASEDAATIYRLQTITNTFVHISQAYVNYFTYSFERIPFEDNQQRRKSPLLFHRMNFQFFLVVQVCKLFEEKDAAISSLFALNKKLHNRYPKIYSAYNDVSTWIANTKKSTIYKKLKELRDKAYAHSDKHEFNAPLKFVFLTELETIECKTLLVQSEQMLNKCIAIYGRTYIFHNLYDSSTTRNYLKSNFRSRRFFFDYARGTKLAEASKQVSVVKQALEAIELEIPTQKLNNAITSIGKLEEFVNSMLTDAYKKG